MENKRLPGQLLGEPTDSNEALAFVRRLQEEVTRLRPEHREAFVKRYVEELPLGRLQAIGRRIMMDVMKAPQGGVAAKGGPEQATEAAERAAPATPRSRGRQRGKRAQRDTAPKA